MHEDPELLKGVLASERGEEEMPPGSGESQHWNLLDRPCGECAAKSSRCFHRQPAIDRTWEVADGYQEGYET